jgi:hypothetical protein
LRINCQRRWIDLEKTLDKNEFSLKERSSKLKRKRKLKTRKGDGRRKEPRRFALLKQFYLSLRREVC